MYPILFVFLAGMAITIERWFRLSSIRSVNRKIWNTLDPMLARGELRTLKLRGYISQACDFLERLPPEMVIQRLTAEAPKEILNAPRWALNKLNVINGIEEELHRRGSRQGVRAG